MLTKKQKQQLEEYYSNTYRAYTLTDNEQLKHDLKLALITLKDIMRILNYKNEDFNNLRNNVLKQYNSRVYWLFEELNNIIDEIEGKHIVFEYNIEIAENIIENYDYDRRYVQLKDQLHKIKQQIQTEKEIEQQINKQIKILAG